MKQLTTLRPAIAMIELIFAIVVMGIVMMSAPMLISTASKSGYVAIQQEGINEAATQMNIILGYPWDENNTDEEYDPTVLNVTNGHINLNGTTQRPKRRAGTPSISKRLYISSKTNSELNASSIGADAGDLDDMDDFNGITRHLIQQGSGSADYIEKSGINITSIVGYMDDNVSGGSYLNPESDFAIVYSPDFTSVVGSTNIKRIQVTLTSSSTETELNKTIILHAFSCNIGSSVLEEKN